VVEVRVYWVDSCVCGSSYPELSDLRELREQGVRLVVALEPRFDSDEVRRLGLELLEIPVADYEAPTLEQVRRALKAIEEACSRGWRVLVHCYAGRGRTGTLLACYLVWKRGLTADEAMREVRRIIPGAIETEEQEEAVRRFWRSLSK